MGEERGLSLIEDDRDRIYVLEKDACFFEVALALEEREVVFEIGSSMIFHWGKMNGLGLLKS